MSVKVSIVLSDDVFQVINTFAQTDKSRSQFIETALRQFIAKIQRDEQQQRDIDIINRHADRLNAETEDALSYQVPL
jgi:metal-responsive CopG/Arc/MetJ family transcriptional regulator